MVEPAFQNGLRVMEAEALASSLSEENSIFLGEPITPTIKRWPALLYDYTTQRIVDDRISNVDLQNGTWVHCKICNCQLRCDGRNPFSSERWNRHIRRSKKHKDTIDGEIFPQDLIRDENQTRKKKRKKMTEDDVDNEFATRIEQESHPTCNQESSCPGAIPKDSFDMLQVYARFGQIPNGAQVIRNSTSPGFQLYSTSCSKILVSRRKNQPDCCAPCFSLFVDSNLKKRIFQNMKTYARTVAILESPVIPENGLIDLQNFLKIPVRNMNYAGKRLRLHVEKVVEHYKPKKETKLMEMGSTVEHCISPVEDGDIGLKLAQIREQQEFLRLGIALNEAHQLLL